MSVNLTAPKQGGTDANISNGHWRGLTALARGFGEEVHVWDGTHDCLFYTPEQLRRIADRVEQVKDDAAWLRELADHGGAYLS